jgi:hypothetical protein
MHALAFQMLGDAAQLPRSLGVARLIGAAQPLAGIEQVDIGFERVKLGELQRPLDHAEEAAQARRGLVDPLEPLGVLHDRLADAANRIR